MIRLLQLADHVGAGSDPVAAPGARASIAYAWVDFLLGGCGYRVAGGTDEIQRNIIAERALGFPREPVSDSEASR